MRDSDSQRDPLEQLADEFAQRYRRGERPTLTEYTRRYPALAGEIRELFPALVEMEQLRHVADGAGFPGAGVALQPEQLGDYRILREVARGGMGIVYEAEQESLGRHVALKVLPLHGLMNPTQLERFRREARAAARLHHTNIVPVFGVGEDQGIHYYAMQFIQGQSLDLVLRELRRLRGKPDLPEGGASGSWARSVACGMLSGQFPGNDGHKASQNGRCAGVPSSALSGDSQTPTTPANRSELGSQSEAQYYRSVARLGVQVAEALAYAHDQGILHRDIKPSNLLLDTHGTAWVTDFGLAKDEESDELTRSGDIVGTLRYMAPERFEGHSDARSDVYGLGITLYEMLTLEAAFHSKDRAQLVQQISAEQPPRPRRLNRAIPSDLETIVLTASAKSPAERYRCGREMAEDLRRFLENRPIRARRPSAWQKVRKWSQRHRPLVVTIAGSVAAMCIVAAAVLVRSNSQIRSSLRREVEAKHLLSAALRRERQESYFHCITLADREWLLNHVSQAEQALDQCAAEPRRWEWFYLKNLMHRELLAVPTRQGPLVHVSFSPDGAVLLSAGKRVQLWDAATGRLLRTLHEQTELVQCAAFSPGGNLIAFAVSDGSIKVCSVATGNGVLTLHGHRIGNRHGVFSVAFSPDGSHIASAGNDEFARIWNARTGEQLIALRGHIGTVKDLAYSPDGRLLATTGSDRTLRLWDTATGAGETILSETWIWHLAFDRTGRRLAAATQTGGILILEVPSGKVLARMQGHDGQALGVAFKPTASVVASAGEDSTIRVWGAKDGALHFVLRGHTDAVRSVAYSPDGTRLASAGRDGTIRVWDATTTQEALTWTCSAHNNAPNVAFRPDGTLLTIAMGRDWSALSAEGRAQVVNPRTSEVLLTLDSEVLSVTQLAVSPDGSKLATASVGGVVKVWDGATGRELITLAHRKAIVSALSFSPDATHLALGSRKRTVDVYSAVTGQLVRTLDWPPWTVSCVAFSPDGKRLAAAGGASVDAPGEVRVWDATDGRLRMRCVGHTRIVYSISFSPDGRWLASAGQNGIRIWEAATGTQRFVLGGPKRWTNAVAFSSNGERLVSAQVDRTITIWDTATWRELLTLRGHRQPPHSVAFSPDGHLIVSADRYEIRVWDGTPPDEKHERTPYFASIAAPGGVAKVDTLGRMTPKR